MVDCFFNLLNIFDEFFWEYIGFALIFSGGVAFTFKTKGFQFKVLANFKKHLAELFAESRARRGERGISPFKLFFTSVGGMVGLGNIAGISLAVLIGGPGSVFWMWVASFAGMLIKYSEIYLGIKYRKPNNSGGYDGGMMHFLQVAFKNKFIPIFAAIMLAIYGVEVYQFLVLTDRIESTFAFDRNLIIAGLLFLTFYSVLGGIKRLSSICSLMMPPFLIIYVLASVYIIYVNASSLPEILSQIIHSAFKGSAAIGGFAGSGFLLTVKQGISRAVYSGDIGIGYDSIVQSETRVVCPKKQARLSIYALFTDTLICTLTTMLVLVSGAWHEMNSLQPADIISMVLGAYFPYADYFITSLFFFAGFTTIIAFLTVGIKCAKFIAPNYGKYIYLIYSFFSFIFFSNYDQEKVILIMEVASGLLLFINFMAILKLRKKIEF